RALLRVPITFPVEKIDGVMVAGMCVPDLRGSQGSFTFITSDAAKAPHGGVTIAIAKEGGDVDIPGPPSPLKHETLSARVTIRRLSKGGAERFELVAGKERVALADGAYTPWVRLSFRAARGISVRGIVRFL